MKDRVVHQVGEHSGSGHLLNHLERAEATSVSPVCTDSKMSEQAEGRESDGLADRTNLAKPDLVPTAYEVQLPAAVKRQLRVGPCRKQVDGE